MLATRPATDTIAVTRTFDGIEEAAHRVIKQIGGMAAVLQGAKVAILKPNFVAGRSAETGSTTSFALLKAVAEEVQDCGAEPVLCEMPGTEFDREATYTILGVEQFCAANGIRILRIDPEGDESRTLTAAGRSKKATPLLYTSHPQRGLLDKLACPQNPCRLYHDPKYEKSHGHSAKA